jgi:hypothetical protein
MRKRPVQAVLAETKAIQPVEVVEKFGDQSDSKNQSIADMV